MRRILLVWIGLLSVLLARPVQGQFIVPRAAATSSCVYPTCFPDATNTGVPAGTSLTAYSGPSTITTNNTVIDSKTITNTCLTIQAQNVVIKNSKIQVTGTGFAGCSEALIGLVDDPNGSFNNWSVTIQDSEIDCGGDPPNGWNNSTALGDAFITGLRLNIHGCENGGDVNQSFDIEDSYIHDLRQCTAAECGGDGSHTDGFQMGGGHFTPPGTNNLVGGVINVTFKHNTMFSMKTGAPMNGTAGDVYFTTSAIISNNVAAGNVDTNVLIDGNLLGGGANTLYCPQNGSGSNWRATNNHFTNRFRSTVGAFQPTAECDDDTFTGNVCHESGAAMTAATGSC